LFKVGLCINIIGKTELVVADDIVCCLHFQEKICGIFARVLVGMVLDAGPAESFLKFNLRDTTGWNFKELIIVGGFFYKTRVVMISELY